MDIWLRASYNFRTTEKNGGRKRRRHSIGTRSPGARRPVPWETSRLQNRVLGQKEHNRIMVPRHCKNRMLFAAILSVLLLAACSSRSETPVFVDDQADLLTPAQEKRVRDLNRRLLQALDIHFMTVVLKKPALNIDTAAVELFQTRRVGGKTRGAKGLLFLVDPMGQAVRVEVGYDLEGIFTDAFVGYIEREQMVPFFRAGRIGPGIEATVEMLVGRALQAKQTGEHAMGLSSGARSPRMSGGGGAKTAVDLTGELPQKPPAASPGDFGPQATPLRTLETYMKVLGRRIKDPDLGLYTPGTRAFFK